MCVYSDPNPVNMGVFFKQYYLKIKTRQMIAVIKAMKNKET